MVNFVWRVEGIFRGWHRGVPGLPCDCVLFACGAQKSLSIPLRPQALGLLGEYRSFDVATESVARAPSSLTGSWFAT